MPRVDEIDHYSQSAVQAGWAAALLAALTVSVARAKPTDLAEVHDELAEAFCEIFTLISHDAQPLPLQTEPRL